MLFYVIITLLIPITMTAIGFLWSKKPPKKINDFYGYRSEMSMKNQKTWDYAHRYFGKLWLLNGGVLILLTACFLYLYKNASNKELSIAVIIITAMQIIVMIVPIILVEKGLKKDLTSTEMRDNFPLIMLPL